MSLSAVSRSMVAVWGAYTGAVAADLHYSLGFMLQFRVYSDKASPLPTTTTEVWQPWSYSLPLIP
jgi:hypothetical protein